MLDAVANPTHTPRRNARSCILANVNQRRKELVDTIPLRLSCDEFGVIADKVIHGATVISSGVPLEIFAEIMGDEGKRATSVFFFYVPQKVRGIADLSFYFFLAIPIVVIRDQSNDDPLVCATGDFKCNSIVVSFARVFPAHAVSALPLGRLIPMW